ncbi:YheC/YheD family protein [Metabacillus sp. 84]|uniref:YheC/YheD family endospore coat-associated protein n=1 Tax=unclassified Metabacillus TaxID=2675274 RepID=UPI003CF541CB
MNSIKTDIFLHDDPFPSIQISTGLLQKSGWSSYPRQTSLLIGRNSVAVRVVIINDKSIFLSLSKSILDASSLPDILFSGKSLHASMNQESISLGPVFAVLTGIKASDGKIALGNMEEYCKELAAYCKEKGGLFYLFSLNDWNGKPLKGWIYHDETWQRAPVPLPSAVHNRLHERRTEQNLLFTAAAAEFDQLGISYFNSRFLNKWEVHEWLEADPVLMPYIPASRKLGSKRDYEEYIKLYADFFIKPIYGSQGKKIFRIKETDSGYLLDDTSSIGPPSAFNETEELFRHMHPRLSREPYMLQETIRIIHYRNKPMDFRMLCHKKGGHNWAVTSMTARVSSENSFVSNLYQGGAAYSVIKILNELYGERKGRSLRHMLSELSIEICLAVERAAAGCYGELGIDLTLDEDGRLWMIEINSKPSKSSEYVTGNVKVRPSAKAVADYGFYLSMQSGV